MKKLLMFAFALTIAGSLSAQKYMTKNGSTKFFSTTPVEDIEALTNTVNAAIDSQTGEVIFKILIKSFKFEKALMQEHFNENYLESHKYPSAEFSGKITNLDEINFKKDGEYAARVEGEITIHGVTKPISDQGTIIVKGDKVHIKSTFNVKPADHDIKVPAAVRDQIAEVIEVTVDAALNAVQ